MNKKILIIGFVVFGVIWVVLMIMNRNKGKPKIEEETMPTPTLISIPIRQEKKNLNLLIEDSIQIPSITEETKKEIEEIKILRNKGLVESDLFSIKFDYQKNKFGVKLKNDSSKNMFDEWIKSNNFSNISLEYFIFKNND